MPIGKSIINLSLKGLSVLLRFYLIIFITKSLSIEELGEYNIFSTTVAILLFVLGMEIHFYYTKYIINNEVDNAINIIFNQLLFVSAFFCVLAPIIRLFIFNSFISSEYFLIFTFVLISDIFSQEVTRIIMAYKYSIAYNLSMFIKSGLWIVGLMLTGFFIELDLQLVFLFWFLGNVLSLIYAFGFSYNKGIIKNFNFKINLNFMLKGIRYSYPFFFSVIAMRLVNYLDRYLIDHNLGKEALGIYAFFISIASVPATLIASGISVQYTPELISSFKDKRRDLFLKNLKEYFGITILLYVIFLVSSYFLIDLVLKYVNKNALIERTDLLFILIFATFLMSLSSICNSILYSFDERRKIVASSFLALVILISSLNFFIQTSGLLGACFAILITYGFLFLTRGILSIIEFIKWE